MGLHGHAVGGVLERFFFSSRGVGIFVSPEVPLFVSLNPLGDRRLCLSARLVGSHLSLSKVVGSAQSLSKISGSQLSLGKVSGS